MDVPHDLRIALTAELAAIMPRTLARNVEELSARYRSAEADPSAPFVRSAGDVAAYTAYRLPATFAAVFAVLTACQRVAPDLQPSSLLDVGAGPGTATWAASYIWPGLQKIIILERDEHMIALGQKLARHAEPSAIRQATWRRIDVGSPNWLIEPAGLCIAAYILGEVPTTEREAFVTNLWTHASDTTIIVEPGTPRGFAAIREARKLLIAQGATIIAPCPHEADCPMPEGDWCHFAQRVTRTPLHRGIKAGTLSYEDEKFSYVAATHMTSHVANRQREPRVLRHPQIRKGHMVFELCTPAGLQHRTVSRSDGPLYRKARDTGWGDTLPTSSPTMPDISANGDHGSNR